MPRIDGYWGACDPNEPRNRRTRCSALVERFEDGGRPTRVLIDTGPDVREQLLHAEVDVLDGVVYTHPHADHVHGIDELRGFWLGSHRRLDVYSDDATQERLDTAFAYCFTTPPGSSYPPFLRRRRIAAGQRFTIDGPGGQIEMTPFRQEHGDIDSLGFRIGGLAYSCDVGGLPEESLTHLAGLDLWIVDALRPAPHPSHFSLGDALGWIERLKPARAVLTHLTIDLDYQTLRRGLPEHVEPAYDGMAFEFAG